MKNLLLASVLLITSVPSFADAGRELTDGLKSALTAQASVKDNPCLQNQQFNFFELMVEAVPLYAPNGKVAGAPPRSVILTMDRCEVNAVDHVQGIPMDPVAERWYTDGNYGVILTTGLDSDKTWVTVVVKRNGAWTNAGQMGQFVSVDMFDLPSLAKAAVKIRHYEEGGIELPYQMHASFRPSWNR